VVFYERITDEDIPYTNEEEESAQPTDSQNKEESDIVMASENEDTIQDPILKRGMTVRIPDEIAGQVEEDNRKYWQVRFMFSIEYDQFIQQLCALWNTKNITFMNYDTK